MPGLGCPAGSVESQLGALPPQCHSPAQNTGHGTGRALWHEAAGGQEQEAGARGQSCPVPRPPDPRALLPRATRTWPSPAQPKTALRPPLKGTGLPRAPSTGVLGPCRAQPGLGLTTWLTGRGRQRGRRVGSPAGLTAGSRRSGCPGPSSTLETAHVGRRHGAPSHGGTFPAGAPNPPGKWEPGWRPPRWHREGGSRARAG